MSGLFDSKDGILRCLLAILLSLALCIALLLISCFILLMTDDPGPSARAVSLAVLFAGAAISGVISVRMTDNLFSGIVTGCALTLILFLVRVIFFKPETDGALSLLLHAAVVACSFAGSFFRRKKTGKNARLKRIKRRK